MLDPRHVRLEDEAVLGLLDVHERRPRDRRSDDESVATQRLVDLLAEPLAHLLELPERALRPAVRPPFQNLLRHLDHLR